MVDAAQDISGSFCSMGDVGGQQPDLISAYRSITRVGILATGSSETPAQDTTNTKHPSFHV